LRGEGKSFLKKWATPKKKMEKKITRQKQYPQKTPIFEKKSEKK
jgi:hypothetical protein